jgi:hypothetical protein
MSKRCVLNFSNGRYIWGQERLVSSLKNVGYKDGILVDTKESDIPFKTHDEVNYGFKAGMINKALKLGYESVLWIDSSVYVGKDVSPIFDYIEKNGYFVFQYGKNHGVNSGEWCADVALEPLGITREESYQIPHAYATLFGINLKKHPDFFKEYLRLAEDGKAFTAPWHNSNYEASVEKNVHGHRHDQTVMSVLMWKMGMRNWIGEEERYEWYRNYLDPGNAILLQHPI